MKIQKPISELVLDVLRRDGRVLDSFGWPWTSEAFYDGPLPAALAQEGVRNWRVESLQSIRVLRVPVAPHRGLPALLSIGRDDWPGREGPKTLVRQGPRRSTRSLGRFSRGRGSSPSPNALGGTPDPLPGRAGCPGPAATMPGNGHHRRLADHRRPRGIRPTASTSSSSGKGFQKKTAWPVRRESGASWPTGSSPCHPSTRSPISSTSTPYARPSTDSGISRFPHPRQ